MSASTATSSANARQVGGDHYRTDGLQHWDIVDPAYLIACASKYVSRHMSKGGRQDLEKAIHYCEKFQERTGDEYYDNKIEVETLLEWARGTRMTGYEIAICYEILCRVDMVRAIYLLEKLIELRYPKVVTEAAPVDQKAWNELPSTAALMNSDNYQRTLREGLEALKPGTPEDGGHHARQPPDEEGETICRYHDGDILAGTLPPSLSTHEWQHRCTKDVQEKYEYGVSEARYLLKPQHLELAKYSTWME